MNHYNEDCHFISCITLVRLSVKRVPKLFDDCSKIDVYSMLNSIEFDDCSKIEVYNMLNSIEFGLGIHVCVWKTVIPRFQGREVNL